MSFPIVLCTGMLRSGSTWSFNVCRLLGKVVAGRERTPMWSGYLLADQFDQFFKKIEDKRPGPTIAKIHKLSDQGVNILQRPDVRAVCTFRDPRDCVASLMTFANQPFEAAMLSIGEALDNIGQYACSPSTLFIRYEDMIKDRVGHIRKIAGHLDIAVDPSLCQKIDQMTNIEQSKRVCQTLQDRPGDKVFTSMNHRVDPETWLHDNHIQSGKWGRWKEEMSPQQTQMLNKAYEPWLRRWGYDGLDWKEAPGQRA